jgi:hypothetical protein
VSLFLKPEKNMKKLIQFPALLFPALLLIVVSVSCGKNVAVGPIDSILDGPGGTGRGSTDLKCGPEQQLTWTFVQPGPNQNHSVDMIFVVDTSYSMDAKRARVASQIPAFVSELSANTDLRIGVMLGHGGGSYYSGRLFAAENSPLVLDSKIHSMGFIKSSLRKTLADKTDDVDGANGEMLLYSVMKSLEADRVAEIQQAGLYRPQAALALVYVTDENDGCFQPEKNGFLNFPDFVPSIFGTEGPAYETYCTGPGLTVSNYPSVAYSRIQSFKGTEPLVLGGIVHIDPARVPQGAEMEESIGHGILQHLGQAQSSVGIEIASPTYK